jgi:hypothetical protein
MAFPGTSKAAVTTESPASGRSGDSSVPAGAADWPVQATNAIVGVVDSVRDKTTGPALVAARWLTYGLVLVVLLVPVAVFALVGVLRLIEGGLWWVSGQWEATAFLHDPIGFVYLLFGAIFTLAGLICWRKGKRGAPA